MAMRAALGRLRFLPRRSVDSEALHSKVKESATFSRLIDPEKYDSLEDYYKAMKPLVEQETKRQMEELAQRGKVYRRNTRLIGITGIASGGLLVKCLVEILGED
ncbi:hypothetical protein ACP70R_039660 [Stipagrostis hirtigluma subsp. patula]